MTVLIVSNSTDEHANEVEPLLNGQTIRFNTDDYLTRLTIGFRDGFLVSLDGQKIDFDQIKSIWVRRPEGFVTPATESDAEKAFVDAEMQQIVFGFLSTFETFWMSHPSAIREAGYKLEQLIRAPAYGLRVPKTIVPTKKSEFLEFWDQVQGQAIYKTLTDPNLGHASQYNTPTTQIQPEQITSDFLEAVIATPNHFQELIPKAYELRVTVIGSQVFTAKLHSQERQDTQLDWRMNPLEFSHSITTLPQDIEDACRSFVHSYGLSYGAIDLIVTPQGEYVFLENNPSGQCLWLQYMLPELKLREALADCLLRGSLG